MTVRWKTLPNGKPRKKPVYLEDALQISIVHQLKQDFDPEELIFIHPPNGGLRGKREAAKLKAMGVKAGAPDLLLWWPERVEHGGILVKTGRMECGFIELKVPANKTLGIVGGILNQNQEAFRDRVVVFGGRWALARSYEEIRGKLKEWGVHAKKY